MSKQTWSEVLINSQVDGTALTAAATASMIPAAAKKTIAANYFDTVGLMIHVKAHGRISSVITLPGTARFDITLGGVVVWDSQAILLDTVAAHVNVPWRLDIWLTLRAIGTTANFMGYGEWACEDILGTPASSPKGSLVAPLPWNTAPVVGTNFDATAGQQLDCRFTQTVTTGSLQCHQFMVKSEN